MNQILNFSGIWKPAISIAALCLVAAGGVSGQSTINPPGSVKPRLVPDKRISTIGRMEDPLLVDTIIETALVASGVGESAMAGYTARIEQILRAAPSSEGDPAQDGEKLLEWMHQTLLTRYVESQTRMDVLLDKGTYNCVSSAVLYVILVRAGGMNIHGVLTPDHAFCRIVDFSGSGIDVETTTVFGFDPGTRHEAVNAFTGRTGFTYVPPGNYKKRRDIGTKELVSLIYQNRIAILQRRGEWTETVGLARDRWELAGSQAARGDFQTALSNYAAEMNRLKRGMEAMPVLGSAAGILGKDHGLEQTASALLGNAVFYALRTDDIRAAREILADPDALTLVPEDFIIERWRDIDIHDLEFRLKSEPFDQAFESINTALSDGFVDQSRWEELALYLWSTEARKRSSGSRWLVGLDFLRQAPESVRSLRQWPDLEETYVHNAVINYHNTFTRALSRRDFQKARGILNEALARFPSSTILIRDRQLLER